MLYSSFYYLKERGKTLECLGKGRKMAFTYSSSFFVLTYTNTRSVENEHGALLIAFPNRDMRKVDTLGNILIYDRNTGLPGASATIGHRF